MVTQKVKLLKKTGHKLKSPQKEDMTGQTTIKVSYLKTKVYEIERQDPKEKTKKQSKV